MRFTSTDGLSLYARDYNSGCNGTVAVVCLAGLTRNSKDFHPLACRLARKHRVIAPDYRGRGHSDYATEWQTYQISYEMADVVSLLDHLSISRAFFVGTSRGGLISMLLASAFKNRMAGVVLNDVGPVLEPAGLARITGYVGKPVSAGSWSDLVEQFRRTNPGFDLTDEEWLTFAQTVFADRGGVPVLDYDPNLAKTLPEQETILNGPLPDLWPMFAALGGLPVCAIRGENSDLLSEATLAEMVSHLPDLKTVTIAGRGHAPFLNEPDAVAAIEVTLKRAL